MKAKSKRGPGRPRKHGRPKGSRNNKPKYIITTVSPHNFEVGDVVTFDPPTEPPPTRLDVLMSEFETELQRVISKLKAVF